MKARWEIDLSPGMRMSPRSAPLLTDLAGRSDVAAWSMTVFRLKWTDHADRAAGVHG
jgi:hypothetical protein